MLSCDTVNNHLPITSELSLPPRLSDHILFCFSVVAVAVV